MQDNTDIARKITETAHLHDAGDHRVEDLAANDPAVGDQIARLALRFISAKGLSEDFADTLEACQKMNLLDTDEMPSP